MSFLGSPFRNQHAIIRSRLADVTDRAKGREGADLRVLFERLALALRSHLLMEETVVYPAMIASRDEKLRTVAIELRERFAGQSARFDALYERWGANRVDEADAETFRSEVEAFALELCARMDAEDEGLYARSAERQRDSA